MVMRSELKPSYLPVTVFPISCNDPDIIELILIFLGIVIGCSVTSVWKSSIGAAKNW